MKDDQIQMPFGLNANNNLVHISEVENGLKCNCKCLCCGTALIAVNKGTKKELHFRHHTISNCSGESLIHKAAKQIILERMQISSPDGNCIYFDSARDEVHLTEITPDILAMIGDRQLIIEICYTHKVDDDKKEKIKKHNSSAIEIDLSDLKLEHVTNTNEFWDHINNPNRVTWLHKASHQEKIEPFTWEQIEEWRKTWEIVKKNEKRIIRIPIQRIASIQGMPWFIGQLLQKPIRRRRKSRRL